jgi:tetratricopeptide (TPR) repeat protein
MRREIVGVVVTIAAAAALAASPDADPEASMRAGDAAFGRGDYSAAVSFYERAEARTTEPGRVAFDLGAAKYRLALAADSDVNRARLAREAEQHFHCCVEQGDPRRARALYAWGACLLLRADGNDVDAARAAAARYTECLEDPTVDADLAADARYSRERARLLTAQLTAAAKPPDDLPQGDESPDRPPQKEPSHTDKEPKPSPGSGRVKPDGSGAPATAVEETEPIETDATSPGSGHLPPVPDGADVPPLDPKDAAAHLDQAAKRIADELKAHRRAGVKPPPPGVRNW